ncbi:PAAR domain-containing protein [uncultured Zobellia sp.]|uniref:PAAR domain-containing protein n=1 Tax=uncultured Zobellia sp. TaxID=255433 RepID=UPI00259457B0|nr:PAAR domain-containing protein [uncultured Zobellia sp.]
MLLAAKHSNIVMGIDIHMVTIPPSPAPVPMPHPFIGYVFDPFDYIPFLGSQVHINTQKRSNAGTMGMLGTYKHIPMGAGFYPATMPLIDHEGIQFFGSMTVKADGSYLSGATFNMMTCSCIGIPLGTPEMYLPASTTIPLPLGNPVFVGGPQVPDLMGVLMKMLMAFGLKFLLKRMGSLGRRLRGCPLCG